MTKYKYSAKISLKLQRTVPFQQQPEQLVRSFQMLLDRIKTVGFEYEIALEPEWEELILADSNESGTIPGESS